jgi:predicted transcriptional regulator
MKYRSRTEILSSILESANGYGVSKTKIMYKAFLSYAQLKEYLVLAGENGLLEYNNEDTTFKTTSKGIKLLSMYQQMDTMTHPAGLTDGSL